MAFSLKNLTQGLVSNYSEVSVADLEKEYSPYLMDGEKITMGFKLIRDALVFTDKRLILTDKQGATGQKMRVLSINLSSIIAVTVETSGFGFDDSEITFTYIKSPELRGHNVTYVDHKLEFPKKYNVQGLYKVLQEIAYDNYLRINHIQ